VSDNKGQSLFNGSRLKVIYLPGVFFGSTGQQCPACVLEAIFLVPMGRNSHRKLNNCPKLFENKE
jgi:hypothetical protein